MEKITKNGYHGQFTSLCIAFFAVSQNLFVPVLSETSLKDNKSFFPVPGPYVGLTPPSAPYKSPPTTGTTTPPYHAAPSQPKTPTSPVGGCVNPPVVSHPPKSRSSGGGGYHYKPPSSGSSGGGTKGGGGYHYSPPSSGSRSGGYHYSPPSSGSRGVSSGGYSHPTPPSSGSSGGSGRSSTPPTTPIGGGTTPTTPPYYPITDPFTGTCNFWKAHPTIIFGLFGWYGTVGTAFGVTNVPGLPSNLNLLQALSNTRNDGYGEPLREGTASLLNSMVNHKFPYTTQQVKGNLLSLSVPTLPRLLRLDCSSSQMRVTSSQENEERRGHTIWMWIIYCLL
ncbi:hypothetical protein MLD38_020048 [Melastoma candidum]|uniref:Uncharacterized protein n=1 Tax=Melastoma candidum TaxID=119954 RepID=A0ACB9QC41_9MYRT|nr:hypothetical protein MLD38_020048 [Melastoma candidum]